MASEPTDFEAFVSANWDQLVRSALLLGCPVRDAEDLVQATLARCYPHWPRVMAASDPRAYVFRALINQYKRARKRKWTGEHPSETLPETSGDNGDLERVEARESLAPAMRRLDEDQRTAVVLRYYADLPVHDIATITGAPIGTVKSRLSRATAVLRASLTTTERCS